MMDDKMQKKRAYPAVFGAPVGSRNRSGATFKGVPFGAAPPLVRPIGACPVGTRVVVAWTCLPLGTGGTVLAALLEGAAEEEPVVEARLAGTFGGFEWIAALESPAFERPSSSLHSARNRSKDESGVPP